MHASRNCSAVGGMERIPIRWRRERLTSAEKCSVRPGGHHTASGVRQTCRTQRKLNHWAHLLPANRPDLAPIAEVAFLELALAGPSPIRTGPANYGTPIRPALHRRPDANWLFGSARNHNFETIADLKVLCRHAGQVQDGCG